LLSDYRVAIVVIDSKSHRDLVKRGAFVTSDGRGVTDARTLASHLALAKAMRKYDLSRTIAFHGRVASARAFSEDFP